MSLGSVQMALRVGGDDPDLAPPALMRALRHVEVSQGDAAPWGFQLTFHTEIDSTTTNDFAVVANELLRPFRRVLVRVSVDGMASTLIDGYITHQQYVPSNAQESIFVVTGEDVSVKMDMIDYSREFPAMPDELVALAVLAPWDILGIAPDVVPTVASLVPYDHVPQQAGTDRQMVQQLAAQNGYVFYVAPGDALFTSRAYWGPPPRDADPCALLDVAVGATSNVDSIQFSYDALAPTTFVGYVMETEIPPYLPIPVLTLESTRSPQFAAEPALRPEALLSLSTRKQLWRDQALDPLRANLMAQAMTNVSTDAVVTAQVEVTTTRLGKVLQAPGVVGVRGTGNEYDGLYYLKCARHQVDLVANQEWNYRQSLTLTREGMGTTATNLEAT